MSLEKESKINKLLKAWPKGTVYLSRWLGANGYSSQLLNRYKNSNWIENVGVGAVKRFGDDISIEGALYALQKQAESTIHIGGKSALSLQGKAHYLQFSATKIQLFGGKNEKLPSRLIHYPWKAELQYFSSSFLPEDIGLVPIESKIVSCCISGPDRAMMESLYLAAKKVELIECYELVVGVNNLRPTGVRQLLGRCTSIKVKRLFLYMAEKAA